MMKILNYINGEWIDPQVSEYLDVINPATGLGFSELQPHLSPDGHVPTIAGISAL